MTENAPMITEQRLKECENRIESSRIEAARALKDIHDGELYKAAGFDSFSEYCAKRWSYGRQRAYQLIRWVEVQERLSTTVDKPIPERQARELTKVPEDKWPEVYQAASAEGEPTAEKIRAHIQKLTPQQAERPRRPAPTQEQANLRELKRAIDAIVTMPFTASEAIEMYGMDEVGEKIQRLIAWCDTAQPALEAPEGTGIILNDNTMFFVPADDLEQFQQAYTRIDVGQELKACASWNRSNPSKRKSRRGVMRHVNQWLSRANEKAAPSGEVSEREQRIVWG